VVALWYFCNGRAVLLASAELLVENWAYGRMCENSLNTVVTWRQQNHLLSAVVSSN